MKSSIKGFFVILAIVMNFALVQGVWARENFEISTFEGIVTSVDETNRTIEINDNVTIYHMGPSWYWDDVVGIPYPSEGDILEIEAFYCDFLDDYVGVSVCYLDQLENGTCFDSIQLRDPATLKPLWNTKAKTTDLSDTAAEATGDGEPNDYSYYHDNDNDYNWKYEEAGPHKKDF
jgi:hypothetical protein